MPYYVYVLENESAQHYIGQTQNLEQRISTHNAGSVRSTKGKGPWKIVAHREVANRSEAMALERVLKRLKNAKRAILFLNDQL